METVIEKKILKSNSILLLAAQNALAVSIYLHFTNKETKAKGVKHVISLEANLNLVYFFAQLIFPFYHPTFIGPCVPQTKNKL